MEDELLLESRFITSQIRSEVYAYLQEKGVSIPAKVKESIDKVFEENDFTSDEDDILHIFGKNDAEDFEQITGLTTQINVQVKGGNSAGDVMSKYTYYGKLSTANAYYENIGLYDGEELVESVRYTEPSDTNHIENKDDWVIVVIEEKLFELGSYTATPRLYIYAPVNLED